MHYRLLLWDFDGTLADSLAVSLRVLNGLALEYDFKPVTDLDAPRRMSIGQFLKEHRIGFLKLPRVTRAFHRGVREHIAEVRLVPGVAEVLRQLHGEGVRHGVLSSNAPENIQICLQANGVADLFAFMAGCFKLRGKARGIKQAVKQHSLDPREVLYVGDEARDVLAARKAGVDVAAVGWGLNDEATLARSEPTYFVAEPAQLLALGPVRAVI